MFPKLELGKERLNGILTQGNARPRKRCAMSTLITLIGFSQRPYSSRENISYKVQAAYSALAAKNASMSSL